MVSAHNEVDEDDEGDDGGEEQTQKDGIGRFPKRKSNKMQSNTDSGGENMEEVS